MKVLRKKIGTSLTWLTVMLLCTCALVIMIRGLGLVEGYDFGAGAYYYADIPGFETMINDRAYQSELPLWLYILLFWGWGALMYRLWCWMDRK